MADNDSWEETWNARIAALERILGACRPGVLHAVVPFFLGGNADVIAFCDHVKGLVYVTADLTGKPGESWADYELMICHRSDEKWGPTLISSLARYTQEAVIGPGDTMDIGPATPDGSTIEALAFDTYATFELFEHQFDLRLCVGITKEELQFKLEHGSDELFEALKRSGVYPFTDLYRASVI